MTLRGNTSSKARFLEAQITTKFSSFAQFLLTFLQSYFLGSHALESTKVAIIHEGLASGDLYYVQIESNPPYGALKYGGISDVAQINYRAISTDRGRRKAAQGAGEHEV